MKKKYQLLIFHMDPNARYLFGNAEIAGMLANGDERVNTYDKYVFQCTNKCIPIYSENYYYQFMIDCNRDVLISIDKETPKLLDLNNLITL